MQIGFLISPYADRSLREVLESLRRDFPALTCIEIGVSLYGIAHCDPPLYLRDRKERKDFESIIVDAGFHLSSLSAHGNPLHPDPEVAKKSTELLQNAMSLMSQLDKCLLRDGDGNPVRVVNCFSGLPAADVKIGKDGSVTQFGKVPGWHVCPWPDEHFDGYEAQMQFGGDVWRGFAREARAAGVNLAFELHPNFLVHNAETYLELLDRAGDDATVLGLNFDPSHFFWRNIDPIAMIRYLNKTLGKNPVRHCHGKDTYADPYNTSIHDNHGCIPYSREADRVWRFVTIGEGWDPINGAHDQGWWARFVTELQLWGYDHVVSIEHEDSRKSFREGLGKAMRVLDRAINRETPGPITWAER
jgi:sugar phosphate isomerase/epimerase